MSLKLEGVQNKKDETVLLRYAYTKKTRRYFSTGVRIPKKFFNSERTDEPVKSGHPDRTFLNKQISDVLHKIEDTKAQIRRENKLETADYVFHKYHQTLEIHSENLSDPIISGLFERFLAANPNYKQRTINLYKVTFNHFKDCFGDLRLSEFDMDKWNKFRQHLFANRCKSVNTVCIRLKKLKCFFRYLSETEGFEFPLKKFPIPKEEIKKLALNSKSLRLIIEYQPLTVSMRNIKDLCLFQCFTGLRISDLKRLNKDHIILDTRTPHLSMNSYKTNSAMTIPLGKEVMDILERHNYKLPIVVEQYYNRSLKTLLKLSKVDQVAEWEVTENGIKTFKRGKLCDIFTNHCCSRSAIAHFFESGYSPAQVSDIVGKNHHTIMKYYLARTSEDSILQKQLQNQTEAATMNGNHRAA